MAFNEIHQRKPMYPVGAGLGEYLRSYGRAVNFPVSYTDLRRYDGLLPTLDAKGQATLWNTVMYRPGELEDLQHRLVETYQLLSGSGRYIEHLSVGSIDFCAYGNSQPFRIKIINTVNDNHDYYYIKQADASRIYGLELEHLLSPNRINYGWDGSTIVEEHIIGVPGDSFIADPARYGGTLNEVRLSKEFVKFNERCFVRLLGDMRAYNFVVDVIHDLDQVQYRIRSIDFDQQNYEGRARIYLPQFYKENLPYVQLAQRVIAAESVEQYRNEERSLLRKRYTLGHEQIEVLLAVMSGDVLSTPQHTEQLAADLAKMHRDHVIKQVGSMGELLKLHMHGILFGNGLVGAATS
jgi:hypothetical protein